MNNKFLNKVVDHIVKETIMDCRALSYSRNTCWSPFFFSCHCKNIYGLKPAEIKYAYKQYSDKMKLPFTFNK
jgi:hypothetical protein